MTTSPPVTPHGGDPLLRIYAWYRFALAILLLLGYFAFSLGRTEAVFMPLLYLGTAVPYAVLNLAVLVGVLARPRHRRPRHLRLILAIDNDAEGRRGAIKAEECYARPGLSIERMPPKAGFKDWAKILETGERRCLKPPL